MQLLEEPKLLNTFLYFHIHKYINGFHVHVILEIYPKIIDVLNIILNIMLNNSINIIYDQTMKYFSQFFECLFNAFETSRNYKNPIDQNNIKTC